MSVNTDSNADTSTENANWGTIVILLIAVITAVVIGIVIYRDSQKPTVPITATAPTAAPAPAAIQGAPGAAAPMGSPAGGSPAGGGQ